MSVWPSPPDHVPAPFRMAPARRAAPTLLLLASITGVGIVVAFGVVLAITLGFGR
jgi:hypothetical protein